MTKKAALTAVAGSAALVIAACGSSSPSGSSGGSSSSSSVPQLSLSQINNSFSAMATLKPLVAKGKGSIAVILPDTVSSTRYVEFDAPYLKESFQKAGLKSSQYVVQNALGSDATQFSDAQTDITKGATVLIVDPIDSGVGAHIESYAKAHGVAVIDYDRLVLGGSRKYYVSFNNVKVGTLIGQGLVSCVSAWGVKKPQVIVMKGAPTDNNATLFAQGYDAVLAPKFSSAGWKNVSNPAGTWDPPTALSEFQQQYTAHPTINAALIPNDENGAPIIHYLQNKGIKAKTFPTTGQDATLTGLQNILTGYQCGTVYKPIYLEAQAAAALALYTRAGITPPATLANGTTQDTQAKVAVKSALLPPTWVTTTNMNSTVIADKFVPASQLCAGKYASACTSAGISG
ncbi:MAG: D-xylose transport system substrate-binding protein [Streptosporangiaceae bacterium]|jgi:D-xylose transport system substrate-binding protein|nr:D-xylose transport system substrate-binding protein [Streptosporangiaceae bacterium]